MEERKFSYPKTFLLGFGFFGVSIIWSVYNAFVPLMLDNKFGLSAGWIGFVMVLDNIAAILIQPPLGVWSDRLRSPLGRRLPFIVVGAPLAAAAFGFIPKASALPLFLVSCITLLLAMAIWRTPVVALMPDITPSKSRSQANGVINFMGGVGMVVATTVGATLYNINPSYAFWMGGGLVIVAAILVLILIKEPKEYYSNKIKFEEVIEESPKENKNIFSDIVEVFTREEKSIRNILLAIFFWFISYNAIETFFTLYCNKHLGFGEGDSAFQFSYIGLIFIIVAIPSGYIANAFGRRKTIMAGILFMIACIISLYFFPVDFLTVKLASVMGNGLYYVSLIAMVAGIGWALININSLPMVVDMTEDSRIGTYTGLYYFFSQAAATVGPLFFGLIIDFAGDQYQLMMLIGPIFLILAMIAMMGVKRGEIKTE
ncbi:MAG: SLC45 family MFS transporter [Anaerolineales bacterium]|nr:SLC45 family MFS transporter [Anaerolineales bacterium]